MAKAPPRIGTHYTLSRHLPKPEVPLIKPCRDCKQVKANTFSFFGQKISGKRDNFVTTDVCKVCVAKKISEKLLAKSLAIRKAAEDFQMETLRRTMQSKPKTDHIADEVPLVAEGDVTKTD